MDMVIKGKNVDLTDALREYAQQKLGRVTKFFDGIIDVSVALNVIAPPVAVTPLAPALLDT